MRTILTIVITIILSTGFAFSQDLSSSGESGLKIPRFVSLRSNHINTRSGPGTRYPIEWVYLQRSAPVEVIAEFELWRKIKDWQGSESWVHKSRLNGKRYVKVITPGENNLFAKDNYQSKVIAKVEDEVVGEIQKCPANNNFCLIQFESISGWLPRHSLYGIYPDEIID